MTRRLGLLRDFNLAEPASGSMLVAPLTLTVCPLSGREIDLGRGAGNHLPRLAPGMAPVAHVPMSGGLRDFAPGLVLALSLLSLQFWTLPVVALAARMPLAVIATVLLAPLLTRRSALGAVTASGFGGFVPDAIPAAIATMIAVAGRDGPAPLAFVVLPLVSAFVTCFANTLVIQTFLSF